MDLHSALLWALILLLFSQEDFLAHQVREGRKASLLLHGMPAWLISTRPHT